MNRTEKVLITGGSGMTGRYLTSLLLAEGFQVVHLSRQQDRFGKVRVFRWDPARQIIDPVILEGVDYIIHLAGANIGEKRWTHKRKKEIISSRVDSALLLHKTVIENRIPLKAFVSASGTGYYGSSVSGRIFTEDDLPSYDFLADTCRTWEEAACRFAGSGIRTVRIRTAVVLEKDSDIIGKYLSPAKFGIFPRIGKGSQYMPWIHIKDLCNIYLKALKDDKMQGPYNAASPAYVTQLDVVRGLAKAMNKKGISFPVPSLMLRVVLGEMANMILYGSRVSPEKLLKAGYQFEFDNLQKALNDIIG